MLTVLYSCKTPNGGERREQVLERAPIGWTASWELIHSRIRPKTHKHSVATANALRTYLPYPCPVPSVYVTVTYISMPDVKCRSQCCRTTPPAPRAHAAVTRMPAPRPSARAASKPLPAGWLRMTLRCFSNTCRPRILVKRSAGFASPGMWFTFTTPAPRNSRILNSFRSTCREFCAVVNLWHKS